MNYLAIARMNKVSLHLACLGLGLAMGCSADSSDTNRGGGNNNGEAGAGGVVAGSGGSTGGTGAGTGTTGGVGATGGSNTGGGFTNTGGTPAGTGGGGFTVERCKDENGDPMECEDGCANNLALNLGKGAEHVIGVNFVGGNAAHKPEALDPSDTAGYSASWFEQKANWNNATGASGTLSDVKDDSGNTVTDGADNTIVGWGATGTWVSTEDPETDPTGNQKLLYGHLDTTASSTTTVQVGGIPYETYDLVVYAAPFVGTLKRQAIYIVNDTVEIYNEPADWSEGDLTQTCDGRGQYVVFRNLSGSDLKLAATPGPSADQYPRAPISGIQIIAPSFE